MSTAADSAHAVNGGEPTGRWRRLFGDDRVVALALALALLVVYALTAQAEVNGSRSPYATDVGEIQNALPRWGTLHFTGYPQYSLLGSLFVWLLGLVGVAPALASSLFSAVWGAIAAALSYRFTRALGAARLAAASATAVCGLALSWWVDAALAEVHTMTMALTIGTMLAALAYRQRGGRRELLWLAALLTQGVVHQRAVAFVAPALLVLVWGRWRPIWQNIRPIIALGLGALATYLYLPLRAWMGATWTFNSPGTWQGFWGLVLDNKSTRIVSVPASWAELAARLQTAVSLLAQDLPLAVLVLGLIGLGLLARRGRRREALALLVLVVVHLAVTVIIWEGRISDALLAVKLPIVWACAVGLAFLVPSTRRRWSDFPVGCAALALLVFLGYRHAPQVLAITRDRSSEVVVQRVAALANPAEPTTVWMPWGHDYWALRYAQTYRGELPGLVIADHNASLESIVASGARLVTPQETFYVFAPSWFAERLGGLALSSAAYGLVEITPSPRIDPTIATLASLGNGIAVASAEVTQEGEDALLVTVQWLAVSTPAADYAVGVHLVDEAGVVLAQADVQHPVYGWYPTTQWTAGELVRDHYRLTIPPNVQPAAVRLLMYTQDEAGFHNTDAVMLPVP